MTEGMLFMPRRRIAMLTAATATAALAGLCGSASADIMTFDVNEEWGGNVRNFFHQFDFSLGEISSIDAITVELATTYIADFEIGLTNDQGQTYVLLQDTQANGGQNSVDLGMTPGDGSLSNVASYRFVASGTDVDTLSESDLAGGFDGLTARSWSTGGSAASDWRFVWNDDAFQDASAVGSVSIEYTAIPSPGTIALAGLAFLAGPRRRRRVG